MTRVEQDITLLSQANHQEHVKYEETADNPINEGAISTQDGSQLLIGNLAVRHVHNIKNERENKFTGVDPNRKDLNNDLCSHSCTAENEQVSVDTAAALSKKEVSVTVKPPKFDHFLIEHQTQHDDGVSEKMLCLSKGMEFPDSKVCVEYLKAYMISIGKRLVTDQTGGKSKRFKCGHRDPSCPFTINTTKTKNLVWRVTNINPIHSETCDGVPIGSRGNEKISKQNTEPEIKSCRSSSTPRKRIRKSINKKDPDDSSKTINNKHKITFMTWNVWKMDGSAALWDLRAAAFCSLLETYIPDVLCVQELHQITSAAIRKSLPTHASTGDGGAETTNAAPASVAVPVFDTHEPPLSSTSFTLTTLESTQDADSHILEPMVLDTQESVEGKVISSTQFTDPEHREPIPGTKKSACGNSTAPFFNAENALSKYCLEGKLAENPATVSKEGCSLDNTAKNMQAEDEGSEDEDPASRMEGGIFYNTNLFRLHAAGAEDLHIPGYPYRRLHYCVLKLKADSQKAMLVATCHLPWAGSLLEVQTGINIRIQSTIRIVSILTALASTSFPFLSANQHPIFLMGDFNEDFHPPRILTQAGYTDCFTALGLPPPPTHPARPSHPQEEARPDRTLDWIFGAGRARPVISAALRDFRGGGAATIHPSDHFPVIACYEL